MVQRWHEWQRTIRTGLVGDGISNGPPPLPWAYELALWQQDLVATRLTGQVQFKRPYPRPLLSEEMRWNGFLLEAMDYITEADKVFRKPPETWGDSETAFARAMLEALAAAEFPLSDNHGQ